MSNIKELIKEWQNKLEILHWNITTERIDPKQVVYEGEGKGGYFIRAFDLIKFIDKIKAKGKNVVGIRFDGNNVELIVENDGEKA